MMKTVIVIGIRAPMKWIEVDMMRMILVYVCFVRTSTYDHQMSFTEYSMHGVGP
jgi:hypothetical protein